jgi:transcriptional regulator with XRE-family HTH domain
MADIPIGMAIRHVREHWGLSKSQLARKMGCQVTYVTNVEKDISGLSVQKLQHFAEVLQTPAWKILRHAERLKERIEGEMNGTL